MTGLVEEIQRASLDTTVPMDALLRRVKLAAAKLQLENVENWVDQELNGYLGEVPSYRKVSGEPAGWNPYHGWIPIHGDSEFIEIISAVWIRESVSSLQDLLLNETGGTVHMPVPPEKVQVINKALVDGQASRVVIQLARGHIVSILSTVRGMVLDWAISLEKQGILGTGISFDQKERKIAQAAMASINIGSIGSFVGNLGSGNISGDITASTAAQESVRDLVRTIQSSLPQLKEAGADVERLERILAKLEVETEHPSPPAQSLRSFLDDARSALAGAAGNLTAEGALALIAKAMNLLPG